METIHSCIISHRVVVGERALPGTIATLNSIAVRNRTAVATAAVVLFAAIAYKYLIRVGTVYYGRDLRHSYIRNYEGLVVEKTRACTRSSVISNLFRFIGIYVLGDIVLKLRIVRSVRNSSVFFLILILFVFVP